MFVYTQMKSRRMEGEGVAGPAYEKRMAGLKPNIVKRRTYAAQFHVDFYKSTYYY